MTEKSDSVRGAERRAHPRFAAAGTVTLIAGQGLAYVSLKNISEGGALLAVDGARRQKLAVGDSVFAALDLGRDANGNPLSASLDARIVRLQGQTDIAVRWTSGDQLSKQQLLRIIQSVAQPS